MSWLKKNQLPRDRHKIMGKGGWGNKLPGGGTGVPVDIYETSNFQSQVSRGKVPGVDDAIVSGRFEGVGADGTYKDIWDGQLSIGQWVAPTTDRIHNLVSTDANDTLAGSGAQKILVQGVSGGLLVSEIVELTGLTNAPTANAYDCINSMNVIQSGVEHVNDGDISATAQVDGTVTSLMLSGNNSTFQAIFKTPSNAELLIDHILYSIERSGGGGTDGEFRLVTFLEDIEIVTASIPVSVTGTGSSAFQVEIQYPAIIPVNSYVKLQAKPTQNNTTGGAVLFGTVWDIDLS